MAAKDENTVVFTRGMGEDNSDIWDDSALIEAYDRAVDIMKLRLGERSDSEPLLNEKKSKKKKSKKKKPKDRNSKKWKIGDRCRAHFSEDGLIYDAVITRIDYNKLMCIVCYADYDNEEEHNLHDLLPPTGKLRNNGAYESEDFESDTMEWYSRPSPHSSSQTSSKKPASRSTTPQHHHQPHGWMPSFPRSCFHNGMPPPFAGFPPFAMPFPSPSGSSFPWTTPPHPGCTPPRIPSVPPPPPVLEETVINGDNEALSSMLIAWYMSGYHTGYYQGLKQGRKCQVSSASSQTADRPTEPS